MHLVYSCFISARLSASLKNALAGQRNPYIS